MPSKHINPLIEGIATVGGVDDLRRVYIDDANSVYSLCRPSALPTSASGNRKGTLRCAPTLILGTAFANAQC